MTTGLGDETLKSPPAAVNFRQRDTTGVTALRNCADCTMHQAPVLPSYPGKCSAVDVEFVPDSTASHSVCDIFQAL